MKSISTKLIMFGIGIIIGITIPGYWLFWLGLLAGAGVGFVAFWIFVAIYSMF